MAKNPRVTDHAVVRYLERARGYDMEAVRAHIAGLCAGASASGSRCLLAEGVRFELAVDGAVITVRPAGTPGATGLDRRAKPPARWARS